MNKNVTKARVEEYYNDFFKSDFDRYFEVERDDQGNRVIWINNVYACFGQPTVGRNGRRRGGLLLTIDFSKINDPVEPVEVKKDAPKNDGPKDGDTVDDVMFSAMFSSIVLMQEAIRSHFYDKIGMAVDVISSMGYPIIGGVFKKLNMNVILDGFNLRPYGELEEIFLEAAKWAFPMMKEKMMESIRAWNGGVLDVKDQYGSSAADIIAENFEEGAYSLKRELSTQRTLVDAFVRKDEILEYLENGFKKDLKAYFKVTRHAGVDAVLFFSAQSNHRLVDGFPSDSPKKNLMFVSILIYMILAERSIGFFDEKYEGVLEDFWRRSKWVYLSCGMGGYDMNVMDMLREAGLAPRKDEAPLLLSVVRKVFACMREIFNQVVNKRPEKGEVLSPLQQLRANGHDRKKVHKRLDEEEKQLKDDLRGLVAESTVGMYLDEL